jgi:hypothetical protein
LESSDIVLSTNGVGAGQWALNSASHARNHDLWGGCLLRSGDGWLNWGHLLRSRRGTTSVLLLLLLLSLCTGRVPSGATSMLLLELVVPERPRLSSVHQVLAQELQDGLNQLHSVRSLQHLRVEQGRGLASHLREICLVLSLEGESLSHLRKLVVCHNQLVVVTGWHLDIELMKTCASLGGIIGGFVANEGPGRFLTLKDW